MVILCPMANPLELGNKGRALRGRETVAREHPKSGDATRLFSALPSANFFAKMISAVLSIIVLSIPKDNMVHIMRKLML